ncbi:hypothetical protein PAPYR_6375 [Paratrimastix pyriformis]|uniref:PH domain-containing protein n=1 Tax=Paratrimastix pyriformis TaxID=342808 RepID=A0ABQ8UMJ3_9EUKA|nr:hypothetical protein PAPYR_6375 [Paratrimastix pyriformis]
MAMPMLIHPEVPSTTAAPAPGPMAMPIHPEVPSTTGPGPMAMPLSDAAMTGVTYPDSDRVVAGDDERALNTPPLHSTHSLSPSSLWSPSPIPRPSPSLTSPVPSEVAPSPPTAAPTAASATATQTPAEATVPPSPREVAVAPIPAPLMAAIPPVEATHTDGAPVVATIPGPHVDGAPMEATDAVHAPVIATHPAPGDANLPPVEATHPVDGTPAVQVAPAPTAPSDAAVPPQVSTSGAGAAPAPAGEADQAAAIWLAVLQQGASFVKYGRQGKPHERHVRVEPIPSGSFLMGWGAKPGAKLSQIVPLDGARAVLMGMQTDTFTSRHPAPRTPAQQAQRHDLDSRALSLILPSRTIDLLAPTAAQANQWAAALSAVLRVPIVGLGGLQAVDMPPPSETPMTEVSTTLTPVPAVEIPPQEQPALTPAPVPVTLSPAPVSTANPTPAALSTVPAAAVPAPHEEEEEEEVLEPPRRQPPVPTPSEE